MWSTEFGSTLFKTVTSRHFKFLNSCLRFDNTHAARKQTDVMAPIRDMRDVYKKLQK